MLEQSYLRRGRRRSDTLLAVDFSIVMVFVLAFSMVNLASAGKVAALTVGPVAGVLLGILLLLSPLGATFWARAAAVPGPGRLVRRAAMAQGKFFRSAAYGWEVKATSALLLVFAGLAVGAAAALHRTGVGSPPPASRATSFRQLEGSSTADLIAERSADFSRTGISGAFLFLGLAIAAVSALPPVIRRANLRLAAFREAHPTYVPRRLQHAWAVPAALLVSTVTTVVAWGVERRLNPSLTPSWLARAGIPSSAVNVDAERRVRRLDLSKVRVTPELATELTGLRSLETLLLPPDAAGFTLDLERLPSLERLEAPASLVRGIEHGNIRELTLHEPGARLQSFRAPRLLKLRIEGRCDSLSGIVAGAPWLRTLRAPEDAYRAAGRGWLPPAINLHLGVVSDEAPLLDWVTSEHARAIISLGRPPAATTRNLDLLQRAIIPLDGLDPGTLAQARSVEWLLLTYRQPPARETLARLGGLAREGLPRLSCLEIVPLDGRGEIDRRGLQTARGRAEILAMLARLGDLTPPVSDR